MTPRLLPLLLALLVPSSARAQQARFDLAGRVTASPFAGVGFAHVGDPRFVAVSTLLNDPNGAHVDVLDFKTLTVVKAPISLAFRNQFAALYGVTMPPDEDLVWYGSGKSGFFLEDNLLAPRRRHVYVELDASGHVTRQTTLGTFGGEVQMRFRGTDAGQRAAWFSIERYDPPPSPTPSYVHVRGPKELALLRLDLVTLASREVAKVTLPARPIVTKFEDRLFVFPSDDFSRFAVVEYDEVRLQLAPPAASVFVVDASTGSSFAVPGLKTAYGAAFSRDGRYLYLGSHQLGTVTRVDIAAQRIDKTIQGLQLTHALVASKTGQKLFILGHGDRYGVCDLPDLTNCQNLVHAPGLVPAMLTYFGTGIASLDGRFFVVEDARPQVPRVPNAPEPNVTMVVGQLVE